MTEPRHYLCVVGRTACGKRVLGDGVEIAPLITDVTCRACLRTALVRTTLLGVVATNLGAIRSALANLTDRVEALERVNAV